uniref:Uncharacterized protein n=1 Tax=Mycobacterium phage JustASigh TaxID=3158894 RepID=A0AAU8GMU2_9CAUD
MSDRFERVFGGDCPVCSHSQRRAHDWFGICELCGCHCATHPWPYASIQRYCQASDATEIDIRRCGLCGHREHGDGPCGCMDLGHLADRLPSCACWPEIMPHPGQREMFVARRILTLARVTIPLWAPKVQLWRFDPHRGMVRVGTFHNTRITNPASRGRELSFDIRVDPDREEQWWEQEAVLVSRIEPPHPILSWLKQVDWRVWALLAAVCWLAAAVVAAWSP